MKAIYTILFFLDLVVLIFLSFFLLRLVDAGGHKLLTVAVGLAIIGSIVLLGTFLGRYVKPQK
jgi:hypothetical protein